MIILFCCGHDAKLLYLFAFIGTDFVYFVKELKISKVFFF